MLSKNEKRNAEKISREKWESLTLGNGFIFSKVMLNESICKRVIEATTDLPPIERIEYIEAEKTIDVRIDSKSVRLDVYVQDGHGTAYNIELQAVDTKELPERSRYYQSVVDLDLIDKGMDYVDISDSYIIFICREDIFNRGLKRYTFKYRCLELDDLFLDDGTTKIFLNSKGITGDINEDTQDVLAHIEGVIGESEFAKTLDNEVKRVKSNKNWRAEYVKQNVNDVLKFRQGAHEKAVEVARNMLKTTSLPLEQISDITKLPIIEIEELKSEI